MRWIVGLTALSLVAVGFIANAPAAMAVDAVILTTSPDPVVPPSTVDLRAGIPVTNAAGLASQEIVQTIDPAKIKLHSRYDITVPAGWTLAYSTDGINFTAPEPTTEAGWALIKAVKATGAVDSQGSVDGKQITSKTAVDNSAPTGAFTAAARSGDGWDVFFDDRGYVYNVFHHDGNGGVGNGAIDCHTRTGAACPGTWPFALTAGSLHTPNDSSGWYDPITKRVWVNINSNAFAGFVCLDFSNLAAANKWCGGSVTTAFVPLEAVTLSAGYAYNGNCSAEPFYYTCISRMVESDGRLFAFNGDTNHLLCLDTTLPGSGGPCPDQPVVFPTVNTAWGHHPLVEWQGRIYGTPGWTQAGALCVVAATLGDCPGWTGAQSNLRTFTPRADRITILPDAQGNEIGICYLQITGILVTIGSPYVMTCFNAAGQTITPPAAFVTAFGAGQLGNRMFSANTPQVSGSRVYWANSGWDVNGKIFCWDMALNAGAGGYCTNWGGSAGKVDLNYTLVLDPINNHCVWTNDDGGEIKTWDTVTATVGCTSMSTQVEFKADSLVPRMGCDPNTAISEWRQFTLLGPTSYTGAKLTVLTELGEPIAGWKDVPIPTVDNPATPSFNELHAVDLSALPVADSGQNPKFIVNFATRNGNDGASATITAVGDAPQLCLNPTAVVRCPTALGPLPNPLPDSTTTVTGSGSSTLTGGSTITMTPASDTLTISGPLLTSCGSILSGVTKDSSTTPLPVAGVTVTLINSATGLPVRDANGNPITTVTGTDGSYSFGYLAPGAYKVSFPTTGTATVKSATVAAGGTGSTTAAAGVAVSAATTLAVGTNGVVNGIYALPIATAADAQTSGQNVSQSYSPLANDVAGTGASFGASAVKLCTAAQLAVTPLACTATTLSVAGQGTYTVTGNTVSFVPCNATGSSGAACSGPFTGVATPVTYQATNNLGAKSASTITPTIVPAPAASADSSSGALNTVQSITLFDNDTPGAINGTTYPLSASSVRLCTTSTANASCTSTTMSIPGQGTYSVNPDGTVSFAPCQATGSSAASCTGPFVGTATPIKYVASDALGQQTSSTITPSVLAPPVDVASPDATSGLLGAAQTVNPMTNDTTPTGVSFVPSTVKLCSNAQTPPTCTATSLIVPGKGVYTVNATTGALTFTPCNATAGNLTVGGVSYAAGCTGTPFTGVAPAATYQVSDNIAATPRVVSSTYTPTVYGVPTASTDLSSGAFNTAQTITPLANDSAGSGTSLDASSVKLCDPASSQVPPNCTATSVNVANVGSYSVDALGVVTFTPLVTFIGPAPALKYQVTDSVGQIANSTITPTVAPPPVDVANTDSSVGVQGAVQSVNPLANDLTPTDVSLRPATVKLCDPSTNPVQISPNCTAASVNIAGVGIYAVDPVTGVITFTPDPSYVGTPTPIGYQVSDSVGRTVASTYAPQVLAAPTAHNDTSSSSYGLPQTVDVVHNDTVDSATTLVDATLLLCGPGDVVPNCDNTSVSVTGVGVYVVNANGTVTFTPDPGYHGTAPALSYQISDALGQVASADLTVTVAPPKPPVAINDSLVVAPGGSADFRPITTTGGLATPGDGALAPASTCLVHPAPATLCDGSVTIAGVGTWLLNATTGVVTFTADPAATPGAQQGVDYRVTDANGQSATATLSPIIPPPPSAYDDYSYGEQGQVQSLFPATNDSAGALSAPLDPTSVRLCDPITAQVAPNCTATSVSVPEGTYRVDITTGEVTFTPVNDAFYGAVTPVDYQIADISGQVATAMLSPEVLPKPAPEAGNDLGSAPYGQSVTLDPLSNDLPGALPSDGSVAAPVVLDTTSLVLCDVTEVPPGCGSTTVTTVDGIYVLDPTTNLVTFTPAPGFSGTVTAPVQYQISNSYTQVIAGSPTQMSQTTSAYLIPTIDPPAPPTATDDSAIGLVNNSVSLSPLGNDTDGERDALVDASIRLCDPNTTPPQSPTPAPGTCAATVVSLPGQGTFVLNPATGEVTFTPVTDWTGTVDLPYVVADASGGVVSANLHVTINAPTAAPDSSFGVPGGAQTLSVLGNDAPAAGTSTSLDVSSLHLCGAGETAPACTQTSVTTANGTYTITSPGVVSFIPASGFVSGSDTIDYVVLDSLGEPATSTITVTVVPPPSPAASNDRAYAPVGHTVVFSPWTNDTALATTTSGAVTYTDSGLTHDSIRLCGPGEVVGSCTQTSITTSEGTYSVDLVTGEVSFNAVAGFTGTAAFPVTYQIANPYTVNAGSGSGTQFASATLTPVIVAPPVPAASDDRGSAGYGQNVTFSPWANDTSTGSTSTGSVTYTDAGFDHLSVLLCAVGESAPHCTATTVTTSEGTYSVDAATGRVTFAPVAGFTGTAAFPVAYQITDNYSATNNASPAGTGTQVVTALLIPTIGPLTPLTAVDDNRTTSLDTPVTLAGASNDTAGTYTIDVTSLLLCGTGETPQGCTQTSVVLPEGTFTVSTLTGEVVFTPASGWYGTVTLPYSVADTSGARDDALLSVTIGAPVLLPASATNDVVTLVPGATSGTINPLANDTTDPSDPFQAATVRLCASGEVAPACTRTTVVTADGTWSVAVLTGEVTFTPAAGFHGSATLPYQVTTHTGRIVDALITAWVINPPNAIDDFSSGRPGQTQVIDPFGNDSPDTAAPFVPSSIRLCGTGESMPHCTKTRVVTADGVYSVDPTTHHVRFTPVSGFSGDATPIAYQLADTAGQITGAIVHPRVRDIAGGSTGLLQLRKIVNGGQFRTGAVTLVADCVGSRGAHVRAIRTLQPGLDARTWSIPVRGGMRCTITETATGARPDASIVPTIAGTTWQPKTPHVLTVGEQATVGYVTTLDQVHVTAGGSCGIEATTVTARTSGDCTITWTSPQGAVSESTRWSHVERGRMRTFEGSQTSAVTITAGVTSRVTFTNTYQAAPQTLTRTLVVAPACTTTADQLPAGAGAGFTALTHIAVPSGCAKPRFSITCTARVSTRSIPGVPRGELQVPCRLRQSADTLEVFGAGQGVHVTITAASHPKRRATAVQVTRFYWST